jgi:hypothetical protein
VGFITNGSPLRLRKVLDKGLAGDVERLRDLVEAEAPVASVSLPRP